MQDDDKLLIEQGIKMLVDFFHVREWIKINRNIYLINFILSFK